MTKFVAALILPPFNIFLIAAFACLLAPRWPRLGRGLLILAFIGGYLVCTPVLTAALLRQLEGAYRGPVNLPVMQAQADKKTAIVVLGGGSYLNAPEYGRDTASRHTLERLRWAARLHRQSKLPLLVTGGTPLGNNYSEAEQMRDVLVEDFGIPVRWLESRSRNTYESAFNTLEMLHSVSVSRIVLVTHAAHMPRSRLVFEHVGFEVVAAPTGFTTRSPATVLHYLPSARGLEMARDGFHELVGIGWYHLRLASAM